MSEPPDRKLTVEYIYSPPYRASPSPSSSSSSSSSSNSSPDSSQTISSTFGSLVQSNLPTNDDTNTISSATSSSGPSRYSIASHSVRISKHGYAIDPIELRYPEVVNNLSSISRRASDAAFDSNQVGHRLLALIRGFWSQPAFPHGKVQKPDKHSSLSSLMREFSLNPSYPHRETLVKIAKDKPARSRKVTATRGASAKAKAAVSATSNVPKAKHIKDQFQTLASLPISPSDARGAKSLFSLFSGSGSGSSQHKAHKTSHHHQSSRSTPADTFSWWIPPNDKDQIYELVSTLCQRMEKIFANETRIINISSPCTVMGDIHGNLSDLRTYERSLWPKAPICVTCNYLFLGDYVDRGDYSIECVIYLFSLKLIAPHRFFMLRGNHEVAAIQRQYTFNRECEFKFGTQLGRQLWKEFNRVFDLMPVAAVIDQQIFCAHGGIPRSITDLRTLVREIPLPLDNPEIQCPAAWEILWNDPITDSELIGMIEMDNAVVTQPQTTQNQPTQPEGNDNVTTTTSSAAITTPERPGAGSGGASDGQPQEQRQQQPAISSDAVLARDPAAALSFYIRPVDAIAPEQADTSQQQQQPLAKAAKEASDKPSTRNVDKANVSNNDDDDGTTLRTVPSDTSSIASTSPHQILNDGFVSNIKRGTAFLFSDQAINHFLKTNKLSHVIRAHEVIPTGFAFHGDGRVITIFSSSKYCGLNNQAACALIDRDRIRILRLDTGDAGE